MTKIGTKYKSTNGLVGTIEDIHGVKRLVIKNSLGKITQTINLKDIDLNRFTKV